MKKPARTGLLTATLVLVGASVAACGGGGAPTDASEDEFCTELTSLFSDVGSLADATDKEALASIKKWGEDLEKVGTPKDMSDEARDGFELMIKQVGDLDEGDTADELQKLDDDLSDSEEKATAAFEKYTADTCGAIDPELPEVPTPSS